MAEPSRLQMFDHLANVPRPEQFAAVRHARQTGLARDAKGGLPVGSGAAAFVVAEAERDHPVLARVPGRESGDGAGVQWVTHAAGGHDDRHLHTRFGAGPRGLVENDLDGGGEAADERGVGRRVDLQFEPARPSAASSRAACATMNRIAASLVTTLRAMS